MEDARKPHFVLVLTTMELVLVTRAVNEAKENMEHDPTVVNPTEVWKQEIATAVSVIDKLGRVK
jgi:methyl coenzyme M reductase subunit C-like uncharacterized protein (methanogenesis marker protein 7)